jgi:D-alanyl-D-alanine dipeptidase
MFWLLFLFQLPVQSTSQEFVREQRAERKPELVEVVELDSTIKLDIRYATSNNFMGRPVYTQARAFLQRPAAEALVRAHTRLTQYGFGILLFDAYRPWDVTKKFWDETPPAQRKFVANPKEGSKHNRGCAVDVSLYDLRTGKEVRMPSAYDEFSERAAADYRGGTREQRRLRDLLRRTMEAEGFTVHPAEWWHFDYRSWREYPVLNIPFDSLHHRK